jgi:hypothetical protein
MSEAKTVVTPAALETKLALRYTRSFKRWF